jgi:hypothetical protein
MQATFTLGGFVSAQYCGITKLLPGGLPRVSTFRQRRLCTTTSASWLVAGLVVLLVVFCFIYLWTIWAYIKVSLPLSPPKTWQKTLMTNDLRWCWLRRVMPEMYVCSFDLPVTAYWAFLARTSKSRASFRTAQYSTLRLRLRKFTNELQHKPWTFKVSRFWTYADAS